jgi:hypothetical protein
MNHSFIARNQLVNAVATALCRRAFGSLRDFESASTPAFALLRRGKQRGGYNNPGLQLITSH